MGKDRIGHTSLVDGGETDLHSHNGPDIIKAGTITTDENGNASVVFVTPFPDVNYAIALSCENSVDTVIAMWLNKTVDGFDIRTNDDLGKAEPNAPVNWIVASYNNL